jgi:hypothetical protein
MLGGLHNVARPLEGHADGLEIRRHVASGLRKRQRPFEEGLCESTAEAVSCLAAIIWPIEVHHTDQS